MRLGRTPGATPSLDRMTRFLTLAHGDASVALSPSVGGAIAAFEWRGRPVLRPTPPDASAGCEVRRHACYPLVPYSNRIADGRLDFGGTVHVLDLNYGTHPHAIHGVGWQRSWAVQAHEPDTALLAYEHRPQGRLDDADTRAWPWPFRTSQWFALRTTGDAAYLRMRLTIENTGQAAFPFGLGWHPFVPRDADTVLGFAAEGVWETDATMLPVRHGRGDADCGFDPPRAIVTTTLDNVFTGWAGQTSIAYPGEGRVTLVRGDTVCRYFVCYIPKGLPFMAVEPVSHMTDAFNRFAQGGANTGTRVLAPGAGFSCTMEIAARLLP